jgi:tRNA wybutosine-synthesizing protein 1
MGAKEKRTVPDSVISQWHRQQYRIVGNNAAVKLCGWTKKSLRDQGICYKQKFYGIESHRCLQMSPSAFWCPNRCLICWRRMEAGMTDNINDYAIDEPSDIIENSIKAQRLLMSGFKGFEGTNMRKWKEAQHPNNAAISLVGEPTLYPRISALIGAFHRKGFSTFLVTNGQYPNVLEGMAEPTNLYISVDAPDRETCRRIDNPTLPDFWERLLRSLELMGSFSCRKVLRLTLVRGWNMIKPEEYARLIEKSGCDFIEAKGYMWLGESRKRLPHSAMPTHREIRDFAGEISNHTGYSLRDEQEASRVVLLSRK